MLYRYAVYCVLSDTLGLIVVKNACHRGPMADDDMKLSELVHVNIVRLANHLGGSARVSFTLLRNQRQLTYIIRRINRRTMMMTSSPVNPFSQITYKGYNTGEIAMRNSWMGDLASSRLI